jgi:type IV secretory pathway protease TraF
VRMRAVRDGLGRWAGRAVAARRQARPRRLRRCVWAAGAALVVGAVGASLALQPRVRLVWNASASAPEGLYFVDSPGALRRGDMVAAWTPRAARRLAAEGHYLPANVPLVRRIAARAGDRVCAVGALVSVNGRVAARRRAADGRKRPMLWWSGCHDLSPGEFFLLMESPDSFDGRYFGMTNGADLLGRARLLWAR